MLIKHSLIALCVLVSSPLMAAQTVTSGDVAGAQVYTVTTKTVSGFVNIANGRNCLEADSKGQPSLVACAKQAKIIPQTKTIRLIQLKQGQCQADGARRSVLKMCNIMDTSQQWTAIESVPAELKTCFPANA